MYHEVIAKITVTSKTGGEKQITERYFTEDKLVLAESENAVMEHLAPYYRDIEVVSIKQSKIKEFANSRTSDNEDVYIITLESTFINENTGEESTTKYEIGMFATSIPDATKKAEEYCRQGFADLNIVGVKRTKWIDIIK